MAEAEGKVFPFESEESIRKDFLEVVRYHGEKQDITYKTDEWNAVCPFSGLPDFGTLIIEYVPEIQIVELKSLKYYLTSFRNVGIYQEAATNRIFEDLYQVIDPKYLKITTIYNIRGGIDSTCFIEKGQK